MQRKWGETKCHWYHWFLRSKITMRRSAKVYLSIKFWKIWMILAQFELYQTIFFVYLCLSLAILDYLGLSQAILGYLQSPAILGFIRLYQAISGFLWISRSIFAYLGLFLAILGYFGLSHTCIKNSGGNSQRGEAENPQKILNFNLGM